MVITVVWSVSLGLKCDKMCWDDYSNHNIMYLISVPMTTALAINLLFLINIIRIIVTKLRDEPSLSTQQLQVHTNNIYKPSFISDFLICLISHTMTS